ncbi:MAG: carboxypeptidase regulatory-like domain-containing protein, partial [Acidobacteriota bacterium]
MARTRSRVVLACHCLALLTSTHLAVADIPIEGRVVGDGRPLAGVEARLEAAVGDYEAGRRHLQGGEVAEPTDRVLSDAQGRFTLTAPEIGMWVVRFQADGFDDAEEVLWPLLQATELPEVGMTRRSPGAADHAPTTPEDDLPRWTIEVVDGQGALRSTLVYVVGEQLPRTMTDDEGRATLGLAEGDGLELSFLSPDGHWGAVELAPKAAEDAATQVLRVRLEALDPWAGRVVDWRTGEPVAQALVWDRNPGRGFTRSDRHGRFQLAGSGELEPLAAAVGYTSNRAGATLSPNERVIPLVPAGEVVGQVVDRGGRSLVGVELRIELQPGEGGGKLPPGLQAAGWRAESTERGHFRLAQLPAGTAYRLYLAKPGFMPQVLAVDPLARLERRSLRVELAASLQGFGRVVDGDEAPVAEAEVRLRPMPGPDGSWQELAVAGPAVLTDGAGRFEIPELSTGLFTLEVAALGFAPAAIPGIEVEEGDSETAAFDLGTVVMQVGASIEGWVTTPDGEPIEGAEIRAGAAAEEPAVLALREPFTATDAEGYFVVADQVPGSRLWLSVAKAGYRPVDLPGITAPGGRPLEVVLQPSASITGRITDVGGLPIAGALVTTRSEPSADPVGASVSARIERQAETDEDGRYELLEVEPGRSTIRAQAHGFQPARRSNLQVRQGAALSGIDLTLDAGATLVGQVYDSDGAPVAGATVHVTDPERDDIESDVFGRTGAEGNFELTSIGLGVRTVVAEDDQGRRALRDVRLVAGEQSIDLVLEGGVEVSGWVLDGGGQPVGGASVLLTPLSAGEHPGQVPQTQTLADGSFLFTSLAAGTYGVVAGRDGFAMQRLDEPIEVADSPIHGLEIELDSGVTLGGEILGLSFDELASVVVRASGGREGGGMTRVGRPDHAGRYRIANLAPGAVQVVAEIPGTGRQVREQLELPDGVPEATLDLRFGSGFTLTGETYHGGAPVVGAQVALRGSDRAQVASSTTGLDGTFQLAGLQEGSYQLILESPSTGLSHRRELSLTSDEHVRLDIESARLAGWVVDSVDGRPIAGASLTLQPPGGPRDAGS